MPKTHEISYQGEESLKIVPQYIINGGIEAQSLPNVEQEIEQTLLEDRDRNPILHLILEPLYFNTLRLQGKITQEQLDNPDSYPELSTRTKINEDEKLEKVTITTVYGVKILGKKYIIKTMPKLEMVKRYGWQHVVVVRVPKAQNTKAS